MTPLETNKPVFFDVDGEPLEGGKIYIGQPNTDPRTNAKTVTFRDAGGATFTAKQPLKTIAGRVVYNGKPIVALVDGEYSMLIFNSSGVQVDYEASVNSEASAELDLSETVRVGMTLADVKTFDVAVGDVVRNVGESTATDYNGKDWLAISSTGSPGDDDTLIDFTNGLQGREVTTYVRTEDFDPNPIAAEIKDGSFSPASATQVWTGSTAAGVAMSAMSESGPGWYVVEDSGNLTYSLYILDLAKDAYGGAALFDIGSQIARQCYFRHTDDTILLQAFNSDTGAQLSNLTIIAIYKV